MFETIRQDVHFALRTLGRNPAFTLAAVAVLALGIGANTAIFSAANAFFFRPLPFGDADRLVTIYETNPEFGWDDAQAAPANVLDWRAQVDAFDDVSAYSEFTSETTTLQEGEPVLVGLTGVMGNFFTTLGVRPALGRVFEMEETWAPRDDVVVISHDLWTSRYGADPGVVGRYLEFTTGQAEIVGVMPPGFHFPSDRTDVWSPVGWDEAARDQAWFRRAHFVRAFARLAPGVTPDEAGAQLQVVVTRLQEEYPATNSGMGAGLTPMRDFLVKDVRTPILILLGAVVLLLLLACTNVANLMLVRATDRSREVAIRHALGAGKLRVARQMLTESLVIALAGGALGLGLGWLGVRSISALSRLGIEGATDLALDHRVVLFTLAAAGLSGLVFGTGPALRTVSGCVGGALRDGSRGTSGGRERSRTAGALVTAEVALALLLVVGAGLMVRTSLLLRQVDPGFRTEGVLAVQFSVPSARYQDRDQVLAFYDQLVATLEARPGIERAGTVAQLPLNGQSWSSQFQAEGWPPERVGFEILHRRADAGYFEALDIPLVRGRMFESVDDPEGPLVVVVNETLAREHFPGEDPVGQKIAYDRSATPESTWYEIVGVVGDQHQQSPAVPVRAEVFENRDQDWGRSNWVVVRGDADAEGLRPIVEGVLEEMDPLIPIARTRTLPDVWSTSMAREQFVLTLLTVFGFVALFLAAVGVYGVTAQAARRRTREIGIRMALGAAGSDVLRLMLRQTLVVVALGLTLGLGMALVASRALSSLLFGVAPTDPATLVAVVGLLGGVAMLACYLPARRATHLNPVSSLRAD